MATVFEDDLTRRDIAIVGYDRLSKYVYRASWSTAEVEHFTYFGIDSRQYVTADFGLRNPEAEEFAIQAIVKYGHPNFRTWTRERDSATECSMRFGFASLNNVSQNSWPRVHLSTISGYALAALIVGCLRQNVLQ
jgi:hypothetical protein